MFPPPAGGGGQIFPVFYSPFFSQKKITVVFYSRGFKNSHGFFTSVEKIPAVFFLQKKSSPGFLSSGALALEIFEEMVMDFAWKPSENTCF